MDRQADEASVEHVPSEENNVRVSRRLGCVIPAAAAGTALSIAGASIVYDWWVHRGPIPASLLLLCILGGPGVLLFARRVYRDPNF